MTAASKGLGTTALQFACEGTKLAICARSDLIERAAEIEGETGQEVQS